MPTERKDDKIDKEAGQDVNGNGDKPKDIKVAEIWIKYEKENPEVGRVYINAIPKFWEDWRTSFDILNECIKIIVEFHLREDKRIITPFNKINKGFRNFINRIKR